ETADVGILLAAVIEFDEIRIVARRGRKHLVDAYCRNRRLRYRSAARIGSTLRRGIECRESRTAVGTASVRSAVFHDGKQHVVHHTARSVEQRHPVALGGADAERKLLDDEKRSGAYRRPLRQNVFLFRPLVVLQDEAAD